MKHLLLRIAMCVVEMDVCVVLCLLLFAVANADVSMNFQRLMVLIFLKISWNRRRIRFIQKTFEARI